MVYEENPTKIDDWGSRDHPRTQTRITCTHWARLKPLRSPAYAAEDHMYTPASPRITCTHRHVHLRTQTTITCTHSDHMYTPLLLDLLYMYEKARHLQGLYVVASDVRRATTPLGFISCCTWCKKRTTPLGFMSCCTWCKKSHDTFRVYMLLQLM